MLMTMINNLLFVNRVKVYDSLMGGQNFLKIRDFDSPFSLVKFAFKTLVPHRDLNYNRTIN